MIILPFELSPIMKNYQLKAFELGIIEGNEKNIRPWIYNKYINQLYMIKDKRFTYTNFDRWHAQEGITECQKLCVETEQLDKDNGIDVIGLIREMLDSGHYVFGRYNEYCISSKKAYRKNYYAHDFLLYGYDEEKEAYYSAGYVANGHYEPFLIPFSDFYEALRSLTTEKLNFHFVKYNKHVDNHLDIQTIYDDLFDYLHSINRRNIVNKGKIYGIDGERFYLDYLNDLYINDRKNMDLRHATFFCEMKGLMHERLCYMQGEKAIPQGLAEQYHSVYKTAELISLLSLKFSLSSDKNLLLKMIDAQKEIIGLESKILGAVIQYMQP